MKRLMYMAAMAAVMVLMSALTACSSDEPDKPEVNTDFPDLDENNAALLEDKIWAVNRGETRWMTEEGNLVNWDQLEPLSGGAYDDAYWFSDGKVTLFQLHTSGPAPEDIARRFDFTYSIDWNTGEVSFYRLDGKAAESKSFVIESITADELVILDKDSRPDVKYRRRVFTPVEKSDEQRWWDEYVDYTF